MQILVNLAIHQIKNLAIKPALWYFWYHAIWKNQNPTFLVDYIVQLMP